jgi:Pentapeptide repeats (8 copies)
MLDNVRREFLGPRLVPVRVILTGRPSFSIERSQFLGDNTPVLTLRPYTADQLREYGSRLRKVLESKPIEGENVEFWPPVDWSHLEQVFTLYQKDPGKMELLGLPLLAHLSLRLMAEWKGRIEDLLSNPTDLYRRLTDLTCGKAGKADSERQDLRQQARLRGLALRRTLQRTAAAITAYGQESIPFKELHLRLGLGKAQMMQEAEAAGQHQPLTELMISFYFKGGNEHLGCEFLHKSFREYLCAEGIVDALKKYGEAQQGALARRTPYWKDFEKSDPRHKFSRKLGELLSPRRLTYDILGHLERLIAWEIDSSRSPRAEKGEPLEPIRLEQWERVRDGLADLWDWWAEGAQLRPQPQPQRDRSDTLQYDPTYASELQDLALPRDRTAEAPEWPPGRLVNIDSNLGDALCRLNVWVHKQLLSGRGWTPELQGGKEQVSESEIRPCQTRMRFVGSTLVFFRPSGASERYLANYIHRINAAGMENAVPFPSFVDLSATDLRGVDLRHVDLRGTKLRGANLEKANLSGADLRRAKLAGADLSGADLRGANLINANLSRAKIGTDLVPEHVESFGIHFDLFGWGGSGLGFFFWFGPDLGKARVREANLSGANLSMADLTESDLSGANLKGVVFQLPNLPRKADKPGVP